MVFSASIIEGSRFFTCTLERSTWYSDAVSWAADFGIAGGIGNDRFAPDQALTREQLAVILYRFSGVTGTEGDLSAYADGAAVSPWAAQAMAWAVEQGRILGTDDSTLSPRSIATRAQTAVILSRWLALA